MSPKGTRSRNWNPVGIFARCKHRSQQVTIGVLESQKLYTYMGWEPYVPCNPDKGGDDDFIVARGLETKLISVKTTTQMSPTLDPKKSNPIFSIRTNSKSSTIHKRNYGKVTIPKLYDEMICIAHTGEWCIWTRKQLEGCRSKRTFYKNCTAYGRIDEPMINWNPEPLNVFDLTK